jgi:formylglycine-generating enzyme required for sulfatase activity
MVKIAAGQFNFQVDGIEIEGGNLAGVDVQYPWESVAQRHHQHAMTVPAFYIDKYPVTNADFKKFIDATKYHPKDDHDFLHDWKGETYPEGWANRPVTWVSLEDARLRCMGREATAARVGVAVCGWRHRWAELPLGRQVGRHDGANT